MFCPRSKEGRGVNSTLNLRPQGTLPGGSFRDGLQGMGVEVVPEREGGRAAEKSLEGEQRTTPELCNPAGKSCFLGILAVRGWACHLDLNYLEWGK